MKIGKTATGTRRIVLAAVAAGWGALIAAPGLAQTSEACMLRCLDHLVYSTCQARCAKTVPPSQAPTPRRASAPTDAPAAASTSPVPAAAPFVPPVVVPVPVVPDMVPAVGTQPSALRPAVAQPALQPSAQPPAQPVASQAPPLPSANPPAPPRPVNEACVLHCLDHGRLYGQCQAICAQ